MREGGEEAESAEEEHRAPRGSGGAAWCSLLPPHLSLEPASQQRLAAALWEAGAHTPHPSLTPWPLTTLPLSPPVHGIKWTCSNGNSSSGFSVEQLVQQILDSHQTKPPPRTHNCLCTGSLGERGSQWAGGVTGPRVLCQAAGTARLLKGCQSVQ